ncbi:uroporphyrinogen-III synthase [Virgibacillus necropolis]|uniref:Uroporphyrinogen-III synthase n=1 Tax=Virgibacillus necropolis TaxID=163877 RepID=A0A221MBV4_9BACI|nr:uroporphyrinogen-III synthase [Virgibacillus necropolis]ASN05089.1 uroporphyrinogen-III synthase [Virgibacillus necropolis]
MLQPLQGKEILITREKSQSQSFADLVKDLGGIPIKIPLLKITCKPYMEESYLLDQVTNYQWIFFTSANGIHCFFKWLKEYEISFSELDSVQFAVVGHKTGEILLEYGITATFFPSIYNAEVMAAEFLQQVTINGQLLIVKGNKSRTVLQEAFTKNNVAFDEITIYETRSNSGNQSLLNNYLNKDYPDFITFTSPSSVEAFIEMVDKDKHLTYIQKTPCVCIGSTTETCANKLGFTQTMIPEQYTTRGMVERIAHYIKERG